MYGAFAGVHVCTTYMSDSLGGYKMVSEPLRLELQTVICCCVDAGNQTQVFWKRGQCYQVRTQFSIVNRYFFTWKTRHLSFWQQPSSWTWFWETYLSADTTPYWDFKEDFNRIFSNNVIPIKEPRLHKWPCNGYSCNTNQSCFSPNFSGNKIKFVSIMKKKLKQTNKKQSRPMWYPKWPKFQLKILFLKWKPKLTFIITCSTSQYQILWHTFDWRTARKLITSNINNFLCSFLKNSNISSLWYYFHIAH